MDRFLSAGAAAVAVFIFVGFLFYVAYQNDNDPVAIEKRKAEKSYKIICLGGHEHYHKRYYNSESIALRVTDNGNPIKCEEQDYNEG